MMRDKLRFAGTVAILAFAVKGAIWLIVVAAAASGLR